MADVLGHLAMALLWAAPAWLLWDRRTTLSLAGFALLAALAPDVDLYLPGVAHHGPTHTVAFVAVVAAGGGIAVHSVAGATVREWTVWSGAPARPSPGTFAASGLALGSLSHLWFDMLASGTNGNPSVEPFWPLFEKPWAVDVIYFSAFAWNGGLLAVAIALHAGLGALDAGAIRPRRAIARE